MLLIILTGIKTRRLEAWIDIRQDKERKENIKRSINGIVYRVLTYVIWFLKRELNTKRH